MVELIIAIIVMGIIGAIAMSRILNANAFNVITAREQIVSVLRMAQQRAIGHEDVVFTLRPVADELVITLEASGFDIIDPVRTPLATVGIRSDSNNLTSCSTPPDPANAITNLKPLIVEFDALGDLKNGGVVDGAPTYPTSITTGMRICLNNDPLMSICVSAAGFAYVGDCDA
ncbi:MAG: hypothetical protein Q8L60_03860 [Gammaproteobacteria bacterium]|nr:hypothetical protein [Gammaproteobacteria bacterium]